MASAMPHSLRMTMGASLASVSDPAGRGSLNFAYDSATGRLSSVTDWVGRVVRYAYDSNGRLSRVTDREGQVTTYAYDGSSSRLTIITDANGHVAVTNVYDSQGRVSTQKDARGLSTGELTFFTYAANADGSKTTTVTYPSTSFDPNWRHTEIDTYDNKGRITQHVSRLPLPTQRNGSPSRSATMALPISPRSAMLAGTRRLFAMMWTMVARLLPVGARQLDPSDRSCADARRATSDNLVQV